MSAASSGYGQLQMPSVKYLLPWQSESGGSFWTEKKQIYLGFMVQGSSIF